MNNMTSCPQCKASVDPQAITCPHCRANLALAALLTKQPTRPAKKIPKGKISPEMLVPRLGDYLIEKGILAPDGLETALARQKMAKNTGETKLIGQILLELGLISREGLDQAVTEQIVKLQSALKTTNEKLEDRVKERTAELEYAMSRLAELDQLKSNFLANISHELRTPLTHIRGYLQLLIGSHLGPLTPDQTEALQIMQKSEERLGKLIEDLIQFSLLERSNPNLQLTVVDLEAVLKKVYRDAQRQCQKKGLRCGAQVPESIPRVKANAEKLTWVLRHLIENAVKFTPEGGDVVIGVQNEEEEVTLYIRDTGIGIPQDQLEEIFEPFHQLDGSATRRYGGTGMGLALVQNIVEAHGSEVEVRSQEGKGSRFSFSLPKDKV